ncbi:MAG: hypothetical protein ABIN67_04580 [Ferruginibacter sp.]
MNKTLYILLIVFLGLTTAAGIWDIIITNQIGVKIDPDDYIPWFLLVNVIAIIGSILLLKYYLHHNYRVAFFTGTIAVIASLGNASVYYIIFTSGPKSYYTTILLLYLCAIIVYAVSLIFSNTKKRYWLKLAGICELVIVLVSVSAFMGSTYAKDVRTLSILRKITQGGTVAFCLVNVMFIMNFLGEIRELKTDNASIPGKRYVETILGFLATVAVVFMIAFGTLLVKKNASQLVWRDDNAQRAQQLVNLAGGARTFVDSEGDSLHYILIKPQKYDPQKKYPLVVCLPYGGYEASAAEALSTGMDRYTYPAYIFVPYCPEGLGWGGIFGTPSLESLVYETISGLDEPQIDIKRRYITGVSRGGYGTWQFICTRPDLFAAAVPVCGGGDPDLASKIVNMPIWAFHGAKDKNVPVSGSRDMIVAIKKAGGHPQYTEYPNEAHNIWNQVIETPGLWDWLFAQKKE